MNFLLSYNYSKPCKVVIVLHVAVLLTVLYITWFLWGFLRLDWHGKREHIKQHVPCTYKMFYSYGQPLGTTTIVKWPDLVKECMFPYQPVC